MRHKLVFLFILLSFTSYSQDFTQSRITPMLEAHSEFISIYSSSKTKSWDCPPKLVRNDYVSFSFLDSLPNELNLDEQYYSKFFTPNCTPFYEVMQTHNNFLPEYLNALRSTGLDEKYAILPLTMSASNPSLKYLNDKSGAWQLSFVIARKYGLTVNQLFDERNDIKESSLAAATYLSFLKTYYLNNELLVVTAFYTSVPFVNKQLNKLDNANPTDFINALPLEVKGYLWYLKSWSSWANSFNLTSSPTFNSSELWTEVQTKDTLSFEIISDFMNIPLNQLRYINPVYVGEIVVPNSNQCFYLPTDKAEIFENTYIEFVAFQKAEVERKKKELAELKKKMESGIPDLNKYKAVTYTVRSGDVLGKIADRNNVKVSQIKQWNNLHSDRIDIGQKLVLYVPKNTTTTLPNEAPDNKIETKPTQPKPGSGTAEIYTVKAGESLWLIAKKFPGVSADNIMEWNGCTEKISPGMKLKIYSVE